MNGWERLAVVVAAPFCVLGFLIGYGDSYISEPVEPPSALHQKLLAEEIGEQEFFDQFWAQFRLASNRELKHCDTTTVEGVLNDFYAGTSTITVMCQKSEYRRIWQGVRYAALPAFVMAMLVLIIGWVIAGFRRPET